MRRACLARQVAYSAWHCVEIQVSGEDWCQSWLPEGKRVHTAWHMHGHLAVVWLMQCLQGSQQPLKATQSGLLAESMLHIPTS